MELDPYEFMGVDYDVSKHDIRQRFKKLARKYHPDKGGDAETFDTLKNSYMYIFKQIRSEEKLQQREKQTYKQYMKERVEQNGEIAKTTNAFKSVSKKKFDRERFNEAYTANRVSDGDDRGYSDFGNRGGPREETVDTKTKMEVKKLQLVVLKEPEPMVLVKENYKMIGVDNVEDFSKSHEQNGQAYMDLHQAHSEQPSIMELGQLSNIRGDYKSVDKMQHDREQKIETTDKEKRHMRWKAKEAEKKEAARRRRHDNQEKDQISAFRMMALEYKS